METHSYDTTQLLAICTADISGTSPLEADELSRAYDLLDRLLDMSGAYPSDESFRKAAETYAAAFSEHSSKLKERYDEAGIKDEISRRLEACDAVTHEARFKAAAAASLHEFAKEVFRTWQTSGIFARRRALKELRQRAGFRLESHRIGNYVAKTFDLMNEAQAEFARAQQARFKADISYKIKPDTYERIFCITQDICR